MVSYNNQFFHGERSLFGQENATIVKTTFGKGESPLKESRNIKLDQSIFQYKYPLWYSQHITVANTIFETMARSGIWYTNDIAICDSAVQAPKTFRRSQNIRLKNVHFSDASESLWNCNHISFDHVQASGNYIGMNSTNIVADHLDLIGDYAFDGAKNVEIHHSTLVAKDAFWNCENITIYDSTINGAYLGWNTKNLTLINCTIESNQGLCYVDHLTMKNCALLHSDLVFEYSTNINADICSDIISVKNPSSGNIRAQSIGNIILEADKIEPAKTKITVAQPSETRQSA
ncbi:DUF3737 family protein [Lacticaseibacillus rhamnosus]|uniref:DUF3737 family protein n=1 Tax=Lacticaseibacillus rhamnosus TaxID=47715 RepID=UPI00065AAA4A|nr:DUF3737 family protein [Lacticaseibacillus rhamnosus]KMO47904.1 hydrogenase [Lacticaseibacillus rhamnosus]OAU04447.1 hydrogenase [Lacticaseibacillus rhamnosus]